MKLTKLITALLFLVPVFSGNANAQRKETFKPLKRDGNSLKVRLPELRNLTIMTANGKM